ncbi:ybaK/ebsC family protein [Bacillus sp. CLL-7-23]|uniref:YbaK/ebsC family protein n=1 Tax=Bacillus changyiensis TaxID=3004103 RepID=A0ABT4X6H4_9BACI|nr:ybaK/ebsC family protein [Bacillus changyiensis]MDA7027896.1 ybaK/ebsC family protein [Bacillus changyiensis]
MDKSGMFKDFNFKLVVIESLLDKEPRFLEELTDLIHEYSHHFEWYTGAGPIHEIKEYLEELTLEVSDLQKIEYLCFDGGNEIYHMLKPDWDGEDRLFDVGSVEGFQHLKNLKTVDYISMCDPQVLEPFKQAGIEIQ